MIEYCLVFLVLVFFFSFNVKTNYFQPKWFLLVQIAICLMTYSLYSSASIPLALFFFYISTSANYFSTYNFNHFAVKYPKMNGPFAGNVAKTLVAILALTSIFLLLPFNIIESFLTVSPFILFIGAAYPLMPERWRIYWQPTSEPKFKNYFVQKPGHKKILLFGYGANPSVATTFLSLLAPFTLFVIDYNQFYFWFTIGTLILTLVAILKMKASAGLGGFVAAMFTFLFYKIGLYTFIPLTIFMIGIYFVSKYYKGKLFHLSGRDDIIKFAVHHAYRPFLSRKITWIIGNGVGSFSFIFPTAQLTIKPKKGVLKNLFIWAHSDIIEFILDGGIIGIVLLILLGIDVGIHSYMSPPIMAFFASYIVNSLTNFPNHLGDSSFLTIIILRLVYGSNVTLPVFASIF